jgi:hypothetical protein
MIGERGAVRWDRRLVVVGVALMLAGVVVVFVPIAMLLMLLSTALGGSTSGVASVPAGDVAWRSVAVPVCALIGLGFVIAGTVVLVRAVRTTAA